MSGTFCISLVPPLRSFITLIYSISISFFYYFSCILIIHSGICYRQMNVQVRVTYHSCSGSWYVSLFLLSFVLYFRLFIYFISFSALVPLSHYSSDPYHGADAPIQLSRWRCRSSIGLFLMYVFLSYLFLLFLFFSFLFLSYLFFSLFFFFIFHLFYLFFNL